MSEANEKKKGVVPKEYAGLYIVWNEDETEIVASGRTIEETRQAAIEAGVRDPLLQKVPRADRLFAGGLA